MLAKYKPPKFEIEDLCIPESDPMYNNAVRCIQTYWKQAADMTKGQRQKYLWYLQKTHINHFVAKPFECHGGTVTAHSLYQRARDDAGNFVRLSWPVYLLLSSLYGDLPKRYKEAIEQKYGTSVIEDYTTFYRSFYPTPTSTMEKSVTEGITSVANIGDFIHRASRDSSSTASETNLSRGPWNIETVIKDLDVSKTKRSPSALESPQKRTKLSDDEILSRLNQHTEAIQKIVHEAQLEQRSKLQEVHHDVEKGVQTLNSMQNDLRQFMSAVASALKDIGEHLNE
ncbi:hypothetical protein TRIATDRAFT_40647 [Trichoderma atroviride IMI 206040]|uniref:Uncharacterized protein n=1 Tax=Hypocrea atroviridis (strain ATCC 20476 / IMI 206040) TaxID=452589 RepID=G9NTF9_HYPAI|nr:uncharacterized protein TRIATDRAFT_40647 [Trichoderma atroviride IMI 206040]EHK46001.1 hypothetical protein TRIATDRAFT_40647 [Trichoderma atroviride IMI 206040]